MLSKASKGDNELLFALNRKLYKELSYLERGKPTTRRRVKLEKYAQQKGICAECGKDLPQLGKGAHLDRVNAIEGYTLGNTQLIHAACHEKRQADRKYS